jgi:DNA-binding MarR family transcriptional regulator
LTGNRDADRRRRFLRNCHIFASVIREITEVQFLQEVSPLPLALSQFHLLKVIATNGTHHVGEMADFLGVSRPAVTKNIDKLERLGLIVRTPCEDDRRATILLPSPKGRRLVRKYEALKSDRLTPVLRSLGRSELDHLADLLERFSLRMIEQEGTGAGLCLRCAAYRDTNCPVARLRGGCPYEQTQHKRDNGVAG